MLAWNTPHNSNLRRNKVRRKKWSFEHGHLHAKKKASREADPFFAC